MSIGAKAGIGVGVAAVAAAVVAAAVFCVVRRRQRKADQSAGYLKQIQISDPLPGSGRTYAGDNDMDSQHSPRLGTAQSELETSSRRYEDMLPREKPRYVV